MMNKISSLPKSPQIYKFEKINTGKTFEFDFFLTNKDINKFANLVGDFNPLHINDEFAQKTFYKGKISHGMLAASLFSTLLGMYCPGRDNILLSLSLKFKSPIRPQSKLIVKGKIISKVESLKILTIKTTIEHEGNVLIEGEAKVSML